jgi:RNA polymerase I-specific transcription initiation factor RRN6
VPAPLSSTSLANPAGPELHYLERGVKFLQMWALTADLGLKYTLLSVQRADSGRPSLHIKAPNFKLTQSLRTQGPQFANDSFIVPDCIEDKRFLAQGGHNSHDSSAFSITGQNRDDLRFRLNWKVIFQQVFGLGNAQAVNVVEVVESTKDGEQTLKARLDRALSCIQEKVKEEKLACSSL